METDRLRLLPRVLLGELHHVLLYELPHPAGAPVVLTELDGQPGQLGHEPAQAVGERGVTLDPARLEKQRGARHTRPKLCNQYQSDSGDYRCISMHGDSLNITVGCLTQSGLQFTFTIYIFYIALSYISI